MPISSLIGHEEQRAQLMRDIETGNVAHAYLFSGPKHLGKLAVAHWFAAELVIQGLDEAAANGARESLERLLHPDVLVLDDLWIAEKNESWEAIATSSNVNQEHRAKKKVKSDTIGIDDVRALQERLHATASSRYLCCIVGSIERLQDSAANALLKILEEPPPRVVFLLTAESSGLLPATIVSRTRVLTFAPLSSARLMPLLHGRDESERAFLLHFAQGAPGKLIALLGDADRLREEKQLHAQAGRYWDLDLAGRIKWLAQFQAPQSDMDRLLLHLGLTLRERTEVTSLPMRHRAYADLVRASTTNAHRGLLLARFALASAPA